MALNASKQYAMDYNTVIAGYQRRIDEELFGKWVNSTGVQLNATLVDFYDDIESGKLALLYVDIYGSEGEFRADLSSP